MRVLVQVPTKDEERDIADVITSIPRNIEGVSKVDVLVVDDDSRDATVSVAFDAGADFVITKESSPGLAQSFNLGLNFFLAKGYDVLVNTDGDNQYFQEKIPDLIEPIILSQADLVIGDRIVSELDHFSQGKKYLQRLGSKILSIVAQTAITDAASGFRAYSRDMASRLNITTRFSYAMETLIQAGNSGARIVTIRCGAKAVTRPSRLFSSNLEHVLKSGQAILRGLVTYRPLATFFALASILATLGLIPFVRYLIMEFSGTAGDHIQSLILGVILLSGAFTSFSIGVLSDLIRSQRIILEQRISLDRLMMTDSSVGAILDTCKASLQIRSKESQGDKAASPDTPDTPYK